MKLIQGIIVFYWTKVASARLLGSAATFSLEETLNLAAGSEAKVADGNGVERKLTCYNYDCDQYSDFAHPNNWCVWNFNNCNCESGYKKQNRDGHYEDTCCAAVSDWGVSHYDEQPAIEHCHTYSEFAHPVRGHDNKLGHTCYNNFGDCECPSGYKKQNRDRHDENTCCAAVSDWDAHYYDEQAAINHCHSYSIFAHPVMGHDNKLGHTCYNNFHDCDCKHPYFEEHEQCCSWDPHMFCKDLDEHDMAVPVAGCHKACDWHDCECPDGYKKHMEGTKCVPHDGPGSGEHHGTVGRVIGYH